MTNEINEDKFGLDWHLRELQQEYIQELPEKIDEIDDIIIGLKGSNAPEVDMRNISGMIHTVKGTAGSYDMNFASTICHNFEDYIATLHVSKTKIEAQIDTFLKFTRLLREYVEAFSSEDNMNLEGFRTKLSNLIPRAISSRTAKMHRVLIIETTKSLAERYTKILQKFNIEASFAKNGYDALGRLLKEDFDSLITVAQIEWIDGLSLISALRVIVSKNQNIPVILITSDTSLKLVESHKPAYMLIKKPELLTDLEKTYMNLLGVEDKSSSVTDEISGKSRNLERILYIDDDKDLQPLVKIGLKQLETFVELKCFTSVKKALNVLHKFNPDLIILDVMMPEMDGPSVLKML